MFIYVNTHTHTRMNAHTHIYSIYSNSAEALPQVMLKCTNLI